MSSWEHSGFHVYAGEAISADDADQRRFLARYLKKCPVSLDRISIVETCGEVKVRLLRKLDDGEDSRELSPLEFLAELQSHIPDIWEQTVRYYGIYSARTRVANKQRQSLSEVFGKTSNASALPLQNINDTPNAMPVNPASIDKKPVSRQWRIWIKKIYEVDPLICKKCGSQMKIVGFIHNSREIKKIAEHFGLPAWRAAPGISTRSNTTAGRETRFVPAFAQLQFTSDD